MPQDSYAAFAREVQYQPPPDARPVIASTSATRPSWFAAAGSSSSSRGVAETSYQAGGVPTWGDSYGGGGGEDERLLESAAAPNEWETRFGWRVDFEAALAYLLGPISALLVLILETKNDYIRFHAYQSAIFSTSLLVLKFLSQFIFPAKWFSIVFTITIILSALALAGRAFRDANSESIGQGGLPRYHLPYIGELADRWVGEE